MRTLTTTLMASAMAFVALQAAHAADVVDEVPAAPAAEYSEPATKDWSGAYVGGTADWHHGEADATGSNPSVGFGGGLYGGYNVQSGQIVYGGEADIGYAGNDSHSSGRRVEQGVNGSIRGRVGVDVNPVLLYGTAGLAVGKAKLSTPGGSDKNTMVGWTAGAGAETLVTDNITARVEYRYTDYASKDFNVGGSTVTSGYDEHSVRVGMGVKF
ncbi:porin family protein [Sinorhizobium garamanticum]|uniref:Porin family protein n=1 Tax=Sinorhizobium garamanticum TaxID=680247 RepID=A0ABY8D9I0_9HYPH|nr:outer membrane protein [Sinorhizobium garamanticum]WEX87546.1 porin family protein [Sinorhizobium garamanticum]